LAKVEYQIDLLDANVSSLSASYVDPANAYLQNGYLDTSKFVLPTFYFEADLNIAAAPGTVYAQLYDVTSGAAVSGSEVSTSSSITTRVRSGPISLTSFHEFKFQLKTGFSNPCWVRAARIIIIDDITEYGEWTSGEEQIEIGAANETTTSATAVNLLNQPIYLYESAPRDGTVTSYFEACFYSSQSGKSVEVSLWNKTDNIEVVEIATTNAVPRRVRSSSITLIDGKEYVVKKRSSSGKTNTVTGARLIIQQSGTITKTQLRKKTADPASTTSTGYIRIYNQTLLDKSDLPPNLTFYYEATMKSSSASWNAYNALYDATSSSIVTDSEQITTTTTWTRLRSGSLILTDQHEFDAEHHTNGGGAYTAASWIIINVILEAYTYINVPDAGSGLDDVSLQAQIPVVDSGAGSDSLSLQAQLTVADTGLGTDAVLGANQVLASDNGSGSDTIGIQAQVSVPETNSGTDALSIQAQLPISDVGSGSDSVGIQAQLPIADSGSGLDSIDVSAGAIPINVSDSSSGSDDLSLQAQVPVTDSGSGSDTAAIQGQIPISDVSSGTDTLNVQGQIPVGETGQGSDAISLQAQIPVSDVGSGSDAATIQGQIPVVETGAGNDAIAVEARVPVSEAGSGLDGIAAQANVPVSDSGLGSDILSLQAQVPITENGQGIDGVSVTGSGAITVSDIGESLDSLFVQAQVAIIDSCQGLEGLSISGLLSILDQCTGNDIIIVSIIGVAHPLVLLVLKDFALPITPAGKMMMIIGDEAVPMNKSDPKKKIFLISGDLAIELA
jgi:hypothetical protein